MPSEHDSTDLILVTGPSGAGRTTAIHALEDVGFEAIDNLPLSLIGALLASDEGRRPLALGLDVRNRDFSIDAAQALVERLRSDPDRIVRLLYLDCAPDTLVSRFSETRRRHPLAPDEDVETGVARERDLLIPLLEQADIVIDTTALTIHELKAELQSTLAHGHTRRLALSLQSFSYKRGMPRGLDMAFDVRFLRNPHWVPELRGLTGRDAPVAEHVAGDERFAGFFRRVEDLILSLLPAYRDEGRAHLAIGFGCTGGRHRSVAVTERLAARLAEAGWRVSTRHRELDRRGRGPARGLQ
ncbi:RNase adapter RapZ [Jannaschia sp. W003]|uniref:RNase adapter RapZ n=1 Tax=Jannaschia sp. W003 TaxID=2867012 RepID=UPI0021A31005|nr:RNase adapter RapZ [Jannaschia sp. W003]UWQ21266.1 RNase adapter RapZ [Jannaschia sp. W003]